MSTSSNDSGGSATAELMRSEPASAAGQADSGRLAGIFITALGGICPVQAEGTIDGRPFYFRARGQRWTIEIGPKPDATADGFTTTFRHEEPWGDDAFAAGWMNEDEATDLIIKAAGIFRASAIARL